MRRALAAAIVLVSPPFMKPVLLRSLAGARIGRNVHIGWGTTLSARRIVIGDHATIGGLTVIRCGGDVRIGDHAIVSSMNLVYGAASFAIGAHSYLGPQSIVNAEEDVTIGHHSGIGPRSMLFTHGVWYPYTEGYVANFSGIQIGDRVWCAAGVFIQPGIHIGDDAFVNSRSVLRRNVDARAMVEGPAGGPVGTVDRIRRPMSEASKRSAIRQMLDRYATVTAARGTAVTRIDGGIQLSRGGRTYRVLVDPSVDVIASAPGDVTLVALSLSELSHYRASRAIVFDFGTYQTVPSRDSVHRELHAFFRSNFGVSFEYRPDPGT